MQILAAAVLRLDRPALRGALVFLTLETQDMTLLKPFRRPPYTFMQKLNIFSILLPYSKPPFMDRPLHLLLVASPLNKHPSLFTFRCLAPHANKTIVPIVVNSVSSFLIVVVKRASTRTSGSALMRLLDLSPPSLPGFRLWSFV